MLEVGLILGTGSDLYLVRLELGEAGRLSVGVGKKLVLLSSYFPFPSFNLSVGPNSSLLVQNNSSIMGRIR